MAGRVGCGTSRPDAQGQVTSLGVLSGADLCLLGAAGHPVCWEVLRRAWRGLDQKEWEHLAESSTLGVLHRDLIKDRPPGRGVEALIFPPCYQLSADLGILLGARTCPARIIATHHESRTSAITYFQPQGTSATVEEIPERVENGAPARRSTWTVPTSPATSGATSSPGSLPTW